MCPTSHGFITTSNRYLNRTLTDGSGLRRQDGGGVVSSVASNNHGRDLAFDFVRDKWQLFIDR